MLHSQIYLDHHATTPLDNRVLEAMLPFFTHDFGNPSSQHAFGLKAREAVEKARFQVANAIGASADEIVFTSGATESNNMAIKCLTPQISHRGKHIITGCTEHHAVLDTCEYLQEQGYEVTYLKPDKRGLFSVEQVQSAIRDDTILISLMLVNNEIGVIQPIAEIAQVARCKQVYVHCDAAQAIGRVPFTVDSLYVDLLSMSGHKIYGPKGVGALYVRSNVSPGSCLPPMMHGGGQEKGRRSGTLNVPGIVGLGVACDLAVAHIPQEVTRIEQLRDDLLSRLQKEIPDIKVNGCLVNRVAGNLSVSFPDVEGPAFKDAVCQRVAVSGTSACSSGGMSHVLQALGLCHMSAGATLRFGLGRTTTQEDIKQAAYHVSDCYWRLRQMGVVKPIRVIRKKEAS